jgi:outer membrane biosynthesis protein TonB
MTDVGPLVQWPNLRMVSAARKLLEDRWAGAEQGIFRPLNCGPSLSIGIIAVSFYLQDLSHSPRRERGQRRSGRGPVLSPKVLASRGRSCRAGEKPVRGEDVHLRSLELAETVMTNAEPTSTNSTNESLETADSQPSLVAVSEENLAALLRAATSSGDREGQHTEEYPEAKSDVIIADDVIPPAAPQIAVNGPESSTSSPAQSIESRLALFAAVKEHRTAIRSGVTLGVPPLDRPQVGKASAKPATEQSENLPARLALEVDPLQNTLPESQRPIPKSIADPATTMGDERVSFTLRSPFSTAIIVSAVIAVIGVSSFLFRVHLSTTKKVALSAPKDSYPLQIQVESLGNGLINVRWNSKSASIANARDGQLVVTEQEQSPRILALTAAQLKIGHLTYHSSSERNKFDLEVTDSSGVVAKESVLSLSSAISSGPQPHLPPEPVTAAKAQSISVAIPSVESPPPTLPKLRAFAPPTAQRNTEQSAIVDAPPTLPDASVTPPVTGMATSPATISPPPPVVNGTSQQQVRVESSVQAANLIMKVSPIYPTIAKSAGVQGTVRFTAIIGKDGRIQDLKLAGGPSMLVDAASTAVKQWVYRPTLLNGNPTEVLTQIDVSFNLYGGPNGSVTPLAVNLPPPQASISPPAAKRNEASQQQVRVEGNVQAASLIKKVIPIYPPLAKSAGIHGTVRFTAIIGKDGRIKDLKLISGPSMLVDAASTAVKQWVYRPTLLNGNPTEVLTQIDVSFN